MRQRYQIFVLALLCGSLVAFSAYWMRGELVKQGIFTTQPMHIPCLDDAVARKVAAQLQSESLLRELCTPDFRPEDLHVKAASDGKWVEVRLTLQCWGRASYSLRRFNRDFDASDPVARERNQKQLDAFNARMKEISNQALTGS